MLKVYSLFSMIRYNYGTNKLTGAIEQGYVDRKYYMLHNTIDKLLTGQLLKLTHVSTEKYIKR